MRKLLFLPVLKINNVYTNNNNFAISPMVLNGYLLSVDKDTQALLSDATVTYNQASIGQKGILNGYQSNNGSSIRIDQGIDSIQVPASQEIDPDLKETQYLVEIDNRIGTIVAKDGSVAVPSYIDDDNIAAYYFSLGVNGNFVSNGLKDSTTAPASGQVIAGARGTVLEFAVNASMEVSTSPYLFNQLGTNETSKFVTPSKTFNNIRSILTYITVTGLTTGYSIQIPIMALKYIS
jgi:hypothetical protein